MAIAALALPVLLKHGTVTSAANERDAIRWVAFDRDQIRSLVSQGKTVFVDVTADWCVVCKSNKKLVIGTREVAD